MVAEPERLMMDERHYHLFVCLCVVVDIFLSLPRVKGKLIVAEPRWFIVAECGT